MEYRKLGNTGISVSRLCFGLLTLSGLQRGLDVREGVSLLKKALDLGVTFFDTAVLYETDEVLNRFLRDVRRDSIVIASKSYDYDYESMRKTVMGVLSRLETPYIDLFLLHEQESSLTLKGHMEALEYLNKLKENGDLRATGISTHRVGGVKGALEYSNLIDIIMTILNFSGLGITDGNRDDMEMAIKDCFSFDIGTIGMKILGGGHLLRDINRAFSYVRRLDFIHSFLIGVEDREELEMDIRLINGLISGDTISVVKGKERYIEIEPWCTGCGLCVDRCSQGAISIVNYKAEVYKEKCVLCSYCAQVCPDFSIKVV